MLSPLGLGLLPSTYEESVRLSEGFHEANQGLRKVLEDKNTGFFGPVAKGAYLMRYNEVFRLVGPKETQSDPQSRHLNAMEGGVFAIDLRREDLVRFTNAAEEEEEDSLVYAQFVVELAAVAVEPEDAVAAAPRPGRKVVAEPRREARVRVARVPQPPRCHLRRELRIGRIDGKDGGVG